MIRVHSLFLFLFFSAVLWAQTSISGKITNTEGQPVPSASVTVEEIGKNAILTYALSDSKGGYKVTINSTTDKVKLTVKAFNHQTQVKEIANKSQTLNFSLSPQATEIKEVKLKTRMITKKGDTISYDLKAFESKNDRTLADVLKKVPGIEVNKDGTVLYQGEPLNKFYVNGKDLMEGGYGTINNALPKDAVQKVEILENHQPVKILQDKVPSDRAAINIKLKNKVTMTGRGEVGVGTSPLLWNTKLTPMFFGQKNQWVVNYKANNTGESVEKEGRILSFGNRWEGVRRNVDQESWIGVETAATPNVPERRYLFNNVHFFSANLLTNPFKNKEWELKANASYTNNAVEREDLQEVTYGTETFSARRLNHFYTNQAKGELIFTKNAKKGFFKNVTTWNSFWNESNADVNKKEITGSRAALQNIYAPTNSFQNSLSSIIPVGEKLVNVMSYISVKNDRQTLESSPSSYSQKLSNSQSYQRLQQNLNIKSTEINHSASVGFSAGKWTLTPEVGLDINFNQMESELYGINGSTLFPYNINYQNNMQWNELRPSTKLSANYKGERLNIYLNAPVNFYGISYKDFLRNGRNREINKTVFEPSFFMNYDFASFWKIRGYGSLNYNFGSFGSIYEGIMMNTPDFFVNRAPQSNVMPENLSKSIGSTLEYRNPLNNLFFNLRYSYGTLKRNLITSVTRNAASFISEVKEFDNTTTSQSQSAEIGKYFPKFKSNLSFSFRNSDSENISMLNSNLIYNKNNSQSLGAKFNNTFFSWLSVDYNISMGWNKNQNAQTNTTYKFSNWSHNLAAYIYPMDNHTIGLVWDDNTYKTLGESAFRNSFYDLSYQYTWAKKKIDFELKWFNITNNKFYETVTISTQDNSIRRSLVYIRPSQVIFTVKFNFK
ncbi:carboxypeptidase regulatory-like domain-containing protein [Riemerella anatipestifer]|uniref:carboxypeptidase regulatory-like domain-containing protein n=1 Tax=Riemerella anatipestifer TaxID=34085 RepID=UPI0030BD4B76